MKENQQSQDFIVKIICVISTLLKKWRGILLVMLVCGMAVDFYKTFTYHPQYSSSMRAVLKLESNTYSNLEAARAYTKTLDYLFNGQVVKNYIMEKTGIQNLEMECKVNSNNDTNIIDIQVLASSKKEALYSLKYITNWYNESAGHYHFDYELSVLEKAPILEYPINLNNHASNFKKGFVYSGIISVFVLGLFAYLKDTVKTTNDVTYHVDARLFAKIPREIKRRGKKFWKKNKKAILINSLQTSFYYKESIKKLRSRLEESASRHGYKTIMVTSSLENEGKSSIAANLALALAKNDHKVLLVDGDIRKPSVYKIFDIDSDKCLNNYLNNQSEWQKQLVYLPKGELFILGAKADLDNAEELTSSKKMIQLLKEVREEFDYVVIDSSPAYQLSEPIMINEYVDASLIVVRQNRASTKIINETINRLVSAKNNLIGCIYNGNIVDLAKKHKVYGYRYGYGRYRNGERES